MTLPFVAADVLRYLAVIAVWTFAGRALLTAAGQRALGEIGWLLAPALGQAVAAIVLGMGAALMVPIHSIATWLWLGMLGLAGFGLVADLRGPGNPRLPLRPTGGTALLLTIATITPALVVLPSFVHGFGASQSTSHPDAWSYSIYGAYLWEYPRFTEGGLAPAYQWASNLSGTRFVAASQPGWLATFTKEGDTAAAYGLLVALSCFVMACASAAIGRVLGLSTGLLCLVALASGGGNWVANALSVSNLDNLLALSYAPVLAVLGLDQTRTSGRGRTVIGSGIAAALAYTYPEFAAVSLGCATLFFAGPVLTQPLGRSVRSAALFVIVTAILVLPYAVDLARFVMMQFASGVGTSPRPAEGVFAGLLLPLVRPAAIWGLGPEDLTEPVYWPATAIAVILFALAMTGLARLALSRILAAVAMLAILTVGFGVIEYRYEYAYGAYKFVLLSWWLMIIAVAFGIRECARVHAGLAAAAAIVACTMFGSSLERSVRASDLAPQPNLATLREVRAAADAAAGEPIGVVVMDNTGAHWAAYFLRDSKTRMVLSTGYLANPAFGSAMARATSVPWDSVRWLLTDANDPGPIVEHERGRTFWRNERYTLWDTEAAGWATVSKIDNGYPLAGGPNLVWIGGKPVDIVATSNREGLATVKAQIALSQALPSPASIRLRARDGVGGECEWSATADVISLVLGLHSGENAINLEKTAPVGVVVAPSADQRHPFMVGLMNPTLDFTAGASEPSRFCTAR